MSADQPVSPLVPGAQAGHYVECISCGKARFTDARDSIQRFRTAHESESGHRDFYEGPIPDDRARRLGLNATRGERE